MNEQRFMHIKRLAQCALLLMPGLIHGGETEHADIHIALIDAATPTVSATIRLETRHARLEQVIDALARKTGVRIHQRDLPDEFVSAMCSGSSVKQVLECLLGPSANFIVRYPNSETKSSPAAQAMELWVLGKGTNKSSTTAHAATTTTTVGRCDPAADVPVQHITVNDLALASAGVSPVESKDVAPTDTRALIHLATADDPAQRADAIAQLAAQSSTNDRLVRQTLNVALQDENADVRTQAVFGLAGSKDAWAATAIENALKDEDVNVRLMAVDSAGDNAQLLHNALSDADETVRSFAALRLGMQ